MASSSLPPIPPSFQIDSSRLPPESSFRTEYTLERARRFLDPSRFLCYTEDQRKNALLWLFFNVTSHLYRNISVEKPKAIAICGYVHHDGLGDYYNMLEMADLAAEIFPQAIISVVAEFGNEWRVPGLSKKIIDTLHPSQRYEMIMLDHYEVLENKPEIAEQIDRALEIFSQADLIIDTPFSKRPYFVCSLISGHWHLKVGRELSHVPRENKIIKFREFSNDEIPWYEQFYLGISPFSLGLLFPKMPREVSLEDISNRSLIDALHSTERPTLAPLHFAYFRANPRTEVFAFYLLAIATQHAGKVPLIQVVINFFKISSMKSAQYSGNKELIPNDDQFLEMLKKQGVSKITLYDKTHQHPLQTHILSESEGVHIQVFDPFPMSNKDFRILQVLAEPLQGCTGDLSFSQVLEGENIPFYEAPSHKSETIKFLIWIAEKAKERGEWSDKVPQCLQILDCLSTSNGNFSYFISLFGNERAEKESPFSLQLELAQRLGTLLSDPEFSHEWRAFCAFLKTEVNFNLILPQQLFRKLVLNQYPEIQEQERVVREDLRLNKITLQEAQDKMEALLSPWRS